jgi:excisionase family DNA binding protein
MFTVPEVAERLKCSPALVYALCADGKLKHHRLGLGRGTIRTSEEQLRQFLKETESRGESVPAPVPLRDIKYRGPAPS